MCFPSTAPSPLTSPPHSVICLLSVEGTPCSSMHQSPGSIFASPRLWSLGGHSNRRICRFAGVMIRICCLSTQACRGFKVLLRVLLFRKGVTHRTPRPFVLCPRSSAQTSQISRVLVKAERGFLSFDRLNDPSAGSWLARVLWVCGNVRSAELSVAGVYFQNKYEGENPVFSQCFGLE